MYKPEYVLENETLKILWDFEIKMVILIPTRKPNIVIINKKQKTCGIGDFSVPAN